MGNTKRYFKSESSANNFAKKVNGEVSPNCGRDQNSFRVRYETVGQSQIAANTNKQYDERAYDFDSDLNGNGTRWHTADDL